MSAPSHVSAAGGSDHDLRVGPPNLDPPTWNDAEFERRARLEFIRSLRSGVHGGERRLREAGI